MMSQSRPTAAKAARPLYSTVSTLALVVVSAGWLACTASTSGDGASSATPPTGANTGADAGGTTNDGGRPGLSSRDSSLGGPGPVSSADASSADASSSQAEGGAVPGNLIANWSFESATVGTSGWMGWQSTLARVANANAPNGHFVALVTEATQASGDGYSIQDNPNTVASATAGESYNATAYVASASTSATGKSISLVLRERDANSNVVNESNVFATLTTAFQQLMISATIQVSGDSLDIYIFQSGSTPGDAFFTDAITLIPAERDGSSPRTATGADTTLHPCSGLNWADSSA
jgi:Carbohydrate binding domain